MSCLVCVLAVQQLGAYEENMCADCRSLNSTYEILHSDKSQIAFNLNCMTIILLIMSSGTIAKKQMALLLVARFAICRNVVGGC